MMAEGDAASAFALPDLSESEVTFDYGNTASPFYGKTTVMAFFASWCSHCQTELPYFEKLYEKYSTDAKVKFVAVRTFRARETEDIHDFVKRFGLKFLIVSDTPKEAPEPSKVAKQYQVKGVPVVFIIDKTGKVRHLPNISDFSKYVEEMSGLIDPLLNE